MHTLPEVEAGPTSGLSSTGSKRVKNKIPPVYKKTESDGSVSIYRNFIVRGNCMNPKHIKDGDIVTVKVFNKKNSSTIEDRLSPEDIVLIYLNDQNFRGYKLRIVKNVCENEAMTYYFVGDTQKDSSNPHAFKDIIGKVIP